VKTPDQLAGELNRAETLFHRAFDRALRWMAKAKDARKLCRRLEKRLEQAVAQADEERQRKRRQRQQRRGQLPDTTIPFPPAEEKNGHPEDN